MARLENVSAWLTRLSNLSLFLDAISITGTGLDSSLVLPVDSHLLALTQKSAGETADHPKTVVVVVVVGIVVVATRRTAIPWIVVPRAAAFSHACPRNIFRCLSSLSPKF